MGRGTFVTAVVIVALGAGGCGGHYTLSAPDHVAPVGAQTAVVIRLQRNDFLVLDLAVKEAAMSFRVGDGPMRAAYTDKLGYAGASVAVPDRPGRYHISVKHTDSDSGEVIAGGAYLYVWDAAKPVMAVDLDSLPYLGQADLPAAQAALRRFTQGANVLYLTRQRVSRHDLAHGQIMACDYPDGPVLLWRRQRWRIVREGRFRVPRVIVEARLVNQLMEIKRLFPGLKKGLCGSSIAAKAFVEAGLACTVVGELPRSPEATWYESWQALAERGL